MLQSINLTRAVYAVAMIAVIATAGFLSTRAFFSDTESSQGNVFAAGSLDLLVGITNRGSEGGPDPLAPQNLPNNGALFAFENLMPGETDTGFFRFESSEDAWLCLAADITDTDENTRLAQEEAAGDNSTVQGELQNYMEIAIWEANDNNADGVVGTSENDTLRVMSLEDFATGEYHALQDSAMGDNPLEADIEEQYEYAYCFGQFSNTADVMANGGTLECDGSSAGNDAQTDSVTSTIYFYAEQMQNNANFVCSGVSDLVIEQDDLAEGDRTDEYFTSNWFFYNDENDTIMTQNQFGANSNSITTGPDGVGAAQMTLHSGTARYNIATYRFRNLELSDINTLKFRIYDDSVSSQTPYLHFNVDFDNSDTWQRRLVFVPTGVAADTWTEVDAIQGGAAMWTLSGGNWPLGGSETGTKPGSTPKSWSSIVADYPDVQTRNTDAFFGVRVGHPGPSGEMGWVDYINVNGQIFNFEG